MHIDSFDAMEV